MTPRALASRAKNAFSPNFKGVAQKMDLPPPFEILEAFGRKSKSKATRAFKFCAKQVPIEVNNWSKFGVDIFNQFSKTIFIPSWGYFEEENFSNLNISELVKDINTKF